MDSRSRKNKVRLLSPIRETSGVIPVHVIPRGTKIMKGAGGHAPILVQALPPDVNNPKPILKPSERHYTEVDQVVSDYLHYSRYGQVMPVVYGGATGVGSISGDGLSCPCCSERNRDSIGKKMALARGEDIFQEDGKSKLPDGSPQDTPKTGLPELNQDPSQMPRHTVIRGPPPHAQHSWGYYQPQPYAGTFLNPEFNRPFVLNAASEDDGRKQRDEHDYINTRILEANFKYDKSMEKLESHLKKGFQLPPDAVFIDRDNEYQND